MALCTKRHMTYLALTFPAVVYLFLMFTAIGQVCFKVDTDQSDFKERYLQLINTIQRRPELSQFSDEDSRDLRRLLQAGELHFLPHSHRSSQGFSHKDASYDVSVVTSQHSPIIHNCSTISQMRVRNKIGHGVSKQAFIADYKGMQVAIKMVTRHIHEVKTCLEQLRRSKLAQNEAGDGSLALDTHRSNSDHAAVDYSNQDVPNSPSDLLSQKRNVAVPQSSSRYSSPSRPPQVIISPSERQRCYTFPTARLMKEVLLSQQLHHTNLVSLLGFCVRSEESDSTDISEHGVISVYELGSRFVLDNLQILPWQTRLRHALEMADLLSYLQHSPLGSLVVPDFKEGHFVMVNGTLKLIDLDDVNNLEPGCEVKQGDDKPCPYNLRCVRALCEGFNAKENLKNMNKLVLKRLLFPLTFPESVAARIGKLNADLDSLTLTADDLKVRLSQIQDILSIERTS